MAPKKKKDPDGSGKDALTSKGRRKQKVDDVDAGSERTGRSANKASTKGKAGRKASVAAETCIWCHVDLSEPNPILSERNKHATYHRQSPHHPCTCCSGTRYRYCPEVPHRSITAQCATEAGLEKWCQKKACYVAYRNGQPYTEIEGFTPVERAERKTKVFKSSIHDTSSMMNTFNFWPIDVLEGTLQIFATKDEIKEDLDGCGTLCKGVWRKASDDPEVVPKRVRKLMENRINRAEKKTTMNDSDQNITAGETERAFEHTKNKVSVGATAIEDKKGNVLRSVQLCRQVDSHDNSDDEDLCMVSANVAHKSDHDECGEPASKVPRRASDTDATHGKSHDVAPTTRHSRKESVKSKETRLDKSGDQDWKGTKKPKTGSTAAGSGGKESKPNKDKKENKDGKKDKKDTNQKSARGKAVAKMRSMPKWQVSQTVSRELAQARRVIDQVGVLEKHFNTDGESVNVSEVFPTEKRVHQRFDEKLSWIYDGEDLDMTEEDKQSERQEVFDKLKGSRRICECIGAVSRCLAATEKDSENYDHCTFKRCLEDAFEADLQLSESLICKYVERASACVLKDIKVSLAQCWHQFRSLTDTIEQGAEQDTVKEWCDAVFDLDLFQNWANILSVSADDALGDGASAQEELPAAQSTPPQKLSSDGISFVIQYTDRKTREHVQRLQERMILEGSLQVLQWHSVFQCTITVTESDESSEENTSSSESRSGDSSENAPKVEVNATMVRCAKLRLAEMLLTAMSNIRMISCPNVARSANELDVGQAVTNFSRLIDRGASGEVKQTALKALQADKNELLKSHLQTPVGSLLVERTRDMMRQKALAEKGVHRAKRMEDQLVKTDLPSLQRKIQEPDCTGVRWTKSLTPYSDLVVEHRKIKAVVPSETLAADKTFAECTAKMTAFEQQKAAVMKDKFVDGLSQIAGKVEPNMKPEAVVQLTIATIQLQKRVSGISCKNMCMDEAQEKSETFVQQERIDFVDSFQKGISACVAARSIGPEHKEFGATHAAVHTFIQVLGSLSVDSKMFVNTDNEQDVTAWMSNPKRQKILDMKCNFHKLIEGSYSSSLSSYLCDKPSRNGAKLLSHLLLAVDNVAQQEGSPDLFEAASNIAKDVWEKLPEYKHQLQHQDGPLANESWRLAAAAIFSVNSEFKPSFSEMSFKPTFDDDDQAPITLQASTVLVLHDWQTAYDCLSKIKSTSKAIMKKSSIEGKYETIVGADHPPALQMYLTTSRACGADLYKNLPAGRPHEGLYFSTVDNLGVHARLQYVLGVDSFSNAMTDELKACRDKFVDKTDLTNTIETADSIDENLRKSTKAFWKSAELKAFKKAYKHLA